MNDVETQPVSLFILGVRVAYQLSLLSQPEYKTRGGREEELIINPFIPVLKLSRNVFFWFFSISLKSPNGQHQNQRGWGETIHLYPTGGNVNWQNHVGEECNYIS